jgi:peptide/nickel transport system permease protein
VQFWHFLINAAQGEFGLSLRQGAKVSRLIAERFPPRWSWRWWRR